VENRSLGSIVGYRNIVTTRTYVNGKGGWFGDHILKESRNVHGRGGQTTIRRELLGEGSPSKDCGRE